MCAAASHYSRDVKMSWNGRNPHNILPFDSLGPFTVANDGFT